MTHRLLLVEQSTTMRQVMEKHAESLGFTVDACSTYAQAAKSLEQQFHQFGENCSGVIFGWPTDPQDDAAEFAQQLESSDHKDLPVVVMSSDLRAEARAWIAGRGNTAILSWKEYQGLEAQLQSLIDFDSGQGAAVNVAIERPDNHDIHLLVVDDSATIRYSMRDLFEQHGYSITLAESREEALRVATGKAIDIAVLDYYLTETTGDILCRELLANEQTGDIVCTILTGTYSDHIIKRSLRAGAVECMFKNESSELLLSRINAISRFVRQKRQLKAEQELLEEVLECIAGAVVLIGKEQRVSYINTPAVEELGLSDKATLVGYSAATFLGSDGAAASGETVHAATWTLPDGSHVDVDYQHTMVESSGYSLLRFAQRSVSIVNSEHVNSLPAHDPDSIVGSVLDQFSFSQETQPFLLQMHHYLDSARRVLRNDPQTSVDADVRISMMMLDVFVKRGSNTELIPVSVDESILYKVFESLNATIAREDHVVVLSENRYAILLRHAEESQAYVLTRKVMQCCLETAISDEGQFVDELALACTGALVGLTKNAAQPMDVLVKHLFNGLELVNRREPNQTILLDVRRLLRAYPKT